MSTTWPTMRLGEVLRKAEETILPESTREYREVTVRLWGKGVVERGRTDGASLSGRRFVAREGQFIASRIDARNGAMGLVPASLDGALVTNDFPLFTIEQRRLLPSFLGWLSRTSDFVELCRRASEGTTNRVRLKEERFLALEFPLPPLAHQQRIVAQIENLTTRLADARSLRRQAGDEAQALLQASTSQVFDGLDQFPKQPIRTLGEHGRNPVQTGPFGAQLHASDFADTGVPVLNVGNVWPEGLRLQKIDHVSPAKAAQLSRYSVETGDLLFARSGATLGKVCLVPEACNNWLMTGHLFRVRFDATRIDNRFAFSALRGARSIHDQIFGQVRGATRPGFNTTLLGNVSVPVPPLDEQRRVVSYLHGLQAHVDALKRLQAETATELDALMPAILDRAFKGEL